MDHFIERTLWCDTDDGRTRLSQVHLRARTEPLVILGEAGMGKTTLLDWIAEAPGYARCSARQLLVRPDPRSLLGDAQVLVIDALDELSIRKEGDAVELVLGKLGALDYPRFVISCRVADWRSATGREAIREQYSQEPLELHIEPFDDDDAIDFLSTALSNQRAQSVVDHFNERGLNGLLGNPQTLELICRVARDGPLPETRYDLLDRATELLRREHRNAKADSERARQPGLAAAGAASAALILTGSEAVVRFATANVEEGELALADVSLLPGGQFIADMLRTRLFKADGADRFTYWHRRIGEFLGARWLAEQANDARKRRRLLSLFHSYGLVPASLRGIHAWLARDPALAPAVIATDPMGVIEYGDADDLTVDQARIMLIALERLAAENPYFRAWHRYSARGIARRELRSELRRLITVPDTPFGLRLLVLEAMKGAPVALDLAEDLRGLVLDQKADFGNRSAAGEALVEPMAGENWLSIIDQLQLEGSHLASQLALELVDAIGYELFDDQVIVDLIANYCKQDRYTLGSLWQLERGLPDSRLAGVLDRLAVVAATLGSKHNRPGNHALTDFAFYLMARIVAFRTIDAARLWAWLEPFDASVGYQSEQRRKLDEILREDEALRRAIQRLVLLEREGNEGVGGRALELRQRSPGLVPRPDDIVALLAVLDQTNLSDERWRDLVLLVGHDREAGSEVRAAAARFAANRPDLVEWLDQLPVPHIPPWQVEQEEREHARRAIRAAQHAEHRREFAAMIGQLRGGDVSALAAPAKAYLNHFSDLGEGLSPHERISDWLGQDLAEAIYEGFEAFLGLQQAKPIARGIAEGIVRGSHGVAGCIIVAALAERIRIGSGLDAVSDDRLMAGYFELRHTKIDEHAGLAGLEAAIVDALQARGLWTEAMRLYHEPQFLARCTYVDGLYSLMREDAYLHEGTQLAVEWLERFPDLPSGPEQELIDRLVRSRRCDDLRRVAKMRVGLNDDERRRNWDAVGLIVDFDDTVARLETGPIEPELLWHMRNRAGGGFDNDTRATLSSAQFEWIVSTFRPLWPSVDHPHGVTSGNTNPWDATEYLARVIRHVGNDPGDDAFAAIRRLRDASVDGYTPTLRVVAAEQARIRVENAYAPPTLEAIDAIARGSGPATAADLQAIMLDELEVVQAKIRSDDAESWRGFYDDNNVPHYEERCRDYLLGLLRQGAVGITLEPETHVARDKEVDISCSTGIMRMPIEVKGQWHAELWHGADEQLDALYTPDWRADGRGIYLVLWFGDQHTPNKALTSPGRGKARPSTPNQLREMLSSGSRAVQDGRVVVFVLDLTRPRPESLVAQG
jgi:hypothetical protein